MATQQVSRGLREDEDADPDFKGQTARVKNYRHANSRELRQNVTRAQGRPRCSVGFKGGSLSNGRWKGLGKASRRQGHPNSLGGRKDMKRGRRLLD